MIKKLKVFFQHLSLLMLVCLVAIFTPTVSYALNAHRNVVDALQQNPDSLIAVLGHVNRTEQEPIAMRDAMIREHGVNSDEANAQQAVYENNHAINERKVISILEQYGWPRLDVIGERGSRTIANVLQHASYETRMYYLPMMRNAVEDGKLNPQLLVRAEDRIATDNGELQIYGGQMKYYPETKSFNVWPVLDPENIDKRRAAIGLGPIKEYLKNRFEFEWDMEEQIARSEKFKREKLINKK